MDKKIGNLMATFFASMVTRMSDEDFEKFINSARKSRTEYKIQVKKA